MRWRKKAKKAAASAPNGGEQGNRRKKGNPQFISNFEICENHSQNLKLKRRTLPKESQESCRQRHQRRRTWESKEESQLPIYQQLRGLREPQSTESRVLSQRRGTAVLFFGARRLRDNASPAIRPL
jgi:hypothetical protein